MRTFKSATRWLCAALYVAAGVNHLARPEFYIRIMPPYLPWHAELVYLSGLFEIALGVLLVVPRYTVTAAWG
ncbi:DoxX family membrane protein [Fimbriiglobus ruber]|uniref:DoxX family protein n=1 Tax=Fimbriiglobus ruber TaxID=1908690 RepID=A0A225DS77_9BACT|nr:DoxX family membrane protein [Fimbriiglobus ruber]OWK40456.1 hypothetical protein FRUB_05375 [Fimbriiglobus ruber]